MHAFNEFQSNNQGTIVARFYIRFGSIENDDDFASEWITYSILAIRLPRIQDKKRQDIRRLIKFLERIASFANKEEPHKAATCLLESSRWFGRGLKCVVDDCSSADSFFDLLISLHVIRPSMDSSVMSMILCTTP